MVWWLVKKNRATWALSNQNKAVFLEFKDDLVHANFTRAFHGFCALAVVTCLCRAILFVYDGICTCLCQWSTIDCMNIVLNINYIYYKYLDFGVFLYEPSKLHWFKAKQVLISPQTLLETIRRLESDDGIIKYLSSFNGTFRRYGGHFEYFVSSSFPVGCSWDKYINFAPWTSHNGCNWNSRIQNCRRAPKAHFTSPRIGVVELL